MKSLIICANPSTESLSFSMAKKIVEIAQNKGHETRRIDLYQDQQQNFLSEEEIKGNASNQTLVKSHQDNITWADELIVIFPYWWGSEPAILKNWVDCNFTAGFAFKYNEKGMPEGLLNKKQVKVFLTNGAPTFYYHLIGGYRWLKKRWRKAIVEFCGMELTGFYCFGGIRPGKEKRIKEVLKNIEKIYQ